MWLLSCSDDNAPDSIEPLLYVNEAADITRTEATLSGGVELQRNTDMPTLHFLYGTMAEPEHSSKELVVNDNKVSLRLVGLTAGTTYYFRLQGGNGSAVINSDVRTFTTMPNDKPKVGMLTVLSQGPTSVIASYAITDDGGESIIETGCYITEENSGDSVKVISEQTESTDGSYRIRIGGLKQNSTYSLIPFAASRAGESKGEPTKITTTNAVVLEAAGKLEELIVAQPVALIVIREKAISERVLPAVSVQRTVFHRANGILPLVARFQVCALHDAAAGKAKYAGLQVGQLLG